MVAGDPPGSAGGAKNDGEHGGDYGGDGHLCLRDHFLGVLLGQV